MRQTFFVQLLLVLAASGAVLWQALQLLYYQTQPASTVWLIGVVSLFAYGLTLERAQATLRNTSANLLLILGLLLTLLGSGSLLLQSEHWVWSALFLGLGSLLFALGSRWATRLGSAFTQVDHAAMLLLAIFHLWLALRYVWSWRFAFIGDEWGFFEVARALNHGASDLTWFATRDSNSFHTVLSIQLQAWVMALVGENVAAWRFSAILPAALSLPAIYVVGHWLGGRQTALLSAIVFAVSHTLLCFAMVPYNNTQALLPIAGSMALFVFAVQRPGSLRFFLVGMMLGASFIVYSLGRLAILPVGIFWLCHAWPNFRVALRRLVEIGSGLVVVAAPILMNLANWKALLKATPAQSEALAEGLTLTEQITRNVLSGLLAFLSNPANTHFVIGPYVDPLSAIFVLIGVSYLIITIGRKRATTAWLIGSLLLLVAMSGIQQYSRIATTRMFSSIIIFALYGGVGGTLFLRYMLPKPGNWQLGGVLIVLVALTALNQYQIQQVTFPNSEKPDITLIVQQFQESGATDGSGMPVFVIDSDPYNSLLKLILPAYAIRPERIILLTAEESLTLAHFCRAGEGEALLIMAANLPAAAAVRQQVARCWPESTETPLRNRAEETSLYRFATAKANASLQREAQSRPRSLITPARIEIPGVRALSAAPDGSVFVLIPRKRQVQHYAATGQRLHTFAVEQRDPTALAVDQQGRIIVAGGEAKLVWYDQQGNVLQKTAASRELYRPFSLGVINQQEIVVTDIDRRQVAHLSATGDLIQSFAVPGITLPAALAVAPDGEHLWIYDAQSGYFGEVSLPEQRLIRLIPAWQSGAEDAVALAWLPNQQLLQTQPNQRRLLAVDEQGTTTQIWSGFDRPTAIAMAGNQRLFVLERNLEQIHILPASTGEPLPRPSSPASPLSPLPTATAQE
ncbi:MAG: hypothetical protein KF832_11570 [Caldilineaceae bacterium]|nr:hypothetical protein [Caldilineaceae bacterium]